MSFTPNISKKRRTLRAAARLASGTQAHRLRSEESGSLVHADQAGALLSRCRLHRTFQRSGVRCALPHGWPAEHRRIACDRKNPDRWYMLTKPEPCYHDVVYTEHFKEAAYVARCRTVGQRNTGASLAIGRIRIAGTC